MSDAKERLVLFAGMVVLISMQLPHVSAVGTSLNISELNTPPYLSAFLPNLTWAQGTNLTEIFLIDDYITDDENDLTYTIATVPNITIIINQSTSAISFYPDYLFEGVRITNITASDGITTFTTPSVRLNVTVDTRSPLWSSPQKSKSTVFQSDFVNFTTIWTDNIALASAMFSINQGSGWSNYSLSSMAGLTNTSQERVQISAPATTQVSWKFYAWDTTGNFNQTDTQTFTVSTKNTTAPPAADDEDDDEVVGAPPTVTPRQIKPILNFSVEPDSIKAFLKQGDAVTKFINIKNLRKENLNITFVQEGLTGLLHVQEENFVLSSLGSKTVAMEISAKIREVPDVYHGRLLVKGAGETKPVPIVVEVNEIEVGFSIQVEILPEYENPHAGEAIRANITFTNKKDFQERQVIIYNALKTLEGEILDSAQTSFNLTRQLSFIVNLTVPQVPPGEYIWYARAASQKETAVNFDSFFVGEQFSVAGFVKNNLLFIVIIMLAATALIGTYRYQKSKERLRLLNLYMMLRQLRDLLEQNKIDEAALIYARIKSAYGEQVSPELIKNKEQLTQEMIKIAQYLQEQGVNKDLAASPPVEQAPPAGQKSEEPQKQPLKSSAKPTRKKNEKTKTKH